MTRNLVSENSTGEDPIQKRNLNWLIKRNICILINGGSNKQAFGVYGPTELADWIVFNCKPELFIQIHKLFDLIEESARLENCTFDEGLKSVVEREKIKIERLTSEKDILTEKLDKALFQIEDQTRKITHLEEINEDQTQRIAHLEEINEDQLDYIDTLLNMQAESNNTLHRVEETANDTNAKLNLVSNSLDVTRNDLNDALLSSQIVANELARQTIENHSTGAIEFTLMFFFSSQVPKSDEHKAEANANSVWIGCACGELKNITRSTPSDKRIIFQRVVNSRDSCKFIYKRLKRYIIKVNYRHILIEIAKLEEFFNEVDRLMDEQGIHESIRNLDIVKTQVKARTNEIEMNKLKDQIANRNEQRASQLERRKLELVTQFGETLYISFAGYRRKVYFQQNGDWTIRFGRGGVRTRNLSNEEILNGRFGRNGDDRIHYE